MRLFRNRPLPSGLVLESDLRIALPVVTALFLAVNVPMPAAFPFAVALLCYALLMFVWFFLPDLLRPNLLLTLATHNPVVGLMFVYLAAVAADEQGVAFQDLDDGVLAATVLQYWAMGFAWEISRKIRQPQEEDAYVTYSRLLGRRGALAVALGAQTVAAGIAAGMWLVRGASPLWPALVAAAWAGSAANTIRHLRSSGARSGSLKEWSERFMLAVAAAAVLEWLFIR
jgi:4-hydroxybenzoate polyprenyltransferase